ncbi:MAG: iron-containing alcohol dehydrogenase [bacterium]|nr:iron-containing alcohol dehydrogenase [bacterium]
MNNDIIPNFHLPTEIYIRQNIINEIAEIVSKYGTRAVLITTQSDFDLYHEKIEIISTNLKRADIGCIIYDELPANPSTEAIDEAVSFIKKTNCNLLIAFGGVESINTTKAVAILLNNYLFSYDLFTNPYLKSNPMTYITVPAHPVFGFEIAPLLYLDEIHDLSKKVYFNHNLYPRATIIDPLLSMAIDEDKVMKTALSSLSISLESVISKQNNDIINTYALKAIDLTFRNLPVAYRDLENPTPRIYLSTASLMSGIAFSIAFLSITMAISLALASKSPITVESAMSLIIPHIMEFNLTSSPGKYVQMSKVMGEGVKDITVIEAAIKAVEAIRRLETDVDIPHKLSNYNVTKSEFKEISNLAMSYPFINNAPRPLNTSEIETILIAAY